MKLIHGNCVEYMRSMANWSIDLIATDPPYGMGFVSNRSKSGQRHKAIKNDAELFFDWLPLSYNILRYGGALLSFCNWETSSAWESAIKEAGFKVVSQVIWDRMHHGMGDLSGAFAPQHDIIWYATKGRRNFKNGRPTSVFRYKRPSPTDDNGHPTCKPVELMVDLIRSVDDGNTKKVFDPFTGSGATGVACVRLGFDFYGCEIEEEYFNIARNRIDAEEKQGVLF